MYFLKNSVKGNPKENLCIYSKQIIIFIWKILNSLMFTKHSCNFIKFEEYGWGILSDFCRSIWQQVNLNSLSLLLRLVKHISHGLFSRYFLATDHFLSWNKQCGLIWMHQNETTLQFMLSFFLWLTKWSVVKIISRTMNILLFLS